MILRSASLVRRLDRETERHVGSLAQLAFYSGTMPATLDDSANGEKIATLQPLPQGILIGLRENREPELITGSSYWRIYDNNGFCVFQGDAK